MDYQAIRQIIISKSLLLKAYSFLQKAGSDQFEALALFAGRMNDKKFEVFETILPLQTSYKLESGLMYAVEGDELHRINQWLYENQMQLIAQIHSHPLKAYHSTTDDRYPIVDTFGGISMVVPNFAHGEMDIHQWAIYRLWPHTSWTALNRNEVNQLIEIV